MALDSEIRKTKVRTWNLSNRNPCPEQLADSKFHVVLSTFVLEHVQTKRCGAGILRKVPEFGWVVIPPDCRTEAG